MDQKNNQQPEILVLFTKSIKNLVILNLRLFM